MRDRVHLPPSVVSAKYQQSAAHTQTVREQKVLHANLPRFATSLPPKAVEDVDATVETYLLDQLPKLHLEVESKILVFSSTFALIVGAGMIGQWVFFMVTGQVPELKSEPLRIRFHLAAEFVTAIGLFVGSIGLLTNQPWRRSAYFLTMVMLLYTVIVSPGYFAQKGQWTFVSMFAVVFLLALVSSILVI